ncbi:MAG: Hsp20/alpha crystallin family protein [Haloarculaceae archaeon]
MSGRNDPLSEIEEILELVTGGGPEAPAALPVDVADTGEEFVVVTDLPGYDREDVHVTLVDETTLAITAEREAEAVDEADRYVTRERQRHSVSRQVGLPAPVEESETSASLDEGVLTVTLPRLGDTSGDSTEIPVE